MTAEFEVEASVLGQSSFSDVEVRHDFEAGDEGVLQEPHIGGHGHLLQRSIHAVADAQVVFQRLQMNVCGAFPDGFAENLIHETHHGRFFVVFQNGHFLTQGVMFCLVHFALDQFIEARCSHAIPGA